MINMKKQRNKMGCNFLNQTKPKEKFIKISQKY